MEKKLAYYIVGLLIGLLVSVFSQIERIRPRVVACDVGQGDALLIIKGSNQILVDGGPSGDKVLDCLGEEMPFWDRSIELIVLTNSDYDHMNGLSSVIERYTVNTFVSSDGVHESDALSRFISTLGQQSIKVEGVRQGDEIVIGEREKMYFKVLWPPDIETKYVAVYSNEISDSLRKQYLAESASRGQLNDRSVVGVVTVNNYKIYLAADSGFQTEKSLIETQKLMDVDYVKVSHHGSKYSSSLEFLQAIRPEIAVISVGIKNRYGHPTAEAMERLSNVGATILRTDERGRVTIEIDGKN